MQKSIILFFLLFISLVSFAGHSRIIQLQTKKEMRHTDSWTSPMKTAVSPQRYQRVRYVFKNPKDSMYVQLKASCGLQGMDPDLKCRASYHFVDSIADGTYTIVINGKPREKISFQDGERVLECTFHQRKRGTGTPQDKKYWFVEHHINDRSSEYFKVDRKGRVLEYCPEILNDLNHVRIGITYHFDEDGQLRQLKYHHLPMVDHFYKNGEFKATLPHGYHRRNKEISERFIYFKTEKLEHSGMVEHERPDGWIEIKRKEATAAYFLHFQEGVLTNWRYDAKDSSEDFSFDISSEQIGTKRMDLLEFVRE